MLILQVRFKLIFVIFETKLEVIFSHILNKSKGGFTPLYIAARRGHEQTVRILLDKGGANVDIAKEVQINICIFETK